MATTNAKKTVAGVSTSLRSDAACVDPVEGDRWRARLDPSIVAPERRNQAQKTHVTELGNTLRIGYGWMEEVDRDSNLRLNPDGLTNPRSRVQLMERPFGTVPYMGRGGGDVEIETMLLPGNEERDMKSCLPKSTAGADRLHYHMHWNPQLPGCVVFPGVRGGEATRAASRRTLDVPTPMFAARSFLAGHK